MKSQSAMLSFIFNNVLSFLPPLLAPSWPRGFITNLSQTGNLRMPSAVGKRRCAKGGGVVVLDDQAHVDCWFSRVYSCYPGDLSKYIIIDATPLSASLICHFVRLLSLSGFVISPVSFHYRLSSNDKRLQPPVTSPCVSARGIITCVSTNLAPFVRERHQYIIFRTTAVCHLGWWLKLPSERVYIFCVCTFLCRDKWCASKGRWQLKLNVRWRITWHFQRSPKTI